MEKHSALLETNYKKYIPVDTDHNAMCSFETEGNDIFEKGVQESEEDEDESTAYHD